MQVAYFLLTLFPENAYFHSLDLVTLDSGAFVCDECKELSILRANLNGCFKRHSLNEIKTRLRTRLYPTTHRGKYL